MCTAYLCNAAAFRDEYHSAIHAEDLHWLSLGTDKLLYKSHRFSQLERATTVPKVQISQRQTPNDHLNITTTEIEHCTDFYSYMYTSVNSLNLRYLMASVAIQRRGRDAEFLRV